MAAASSRAFYVYSEYIQKSGWLLFQWTTIWCDEDALATYLSAPVTLSMAAMVG